MSRRARAIGFAALALVCAGLAASAAGDLHGNLEAQLGELRPLLVARSEIEVRRPVRPREATKLFEVRRVPARFAPVDGLADPLEAVGMQPDGPIPAGAYVTAAHFRPSSAGRSGAPRLAGDHEAVEITVTGAEALAAGGGDPTGRGVDVIVTTEPDAGGGRGRTYVAAEGVRLLGLTETAPAGDAGGLGPTGPASWTATVAVGRRQALRLIQAHNYAREMRLIAASGG